MEIIEMLISEVGNGVTEPIWAKLKSNGIAVVKYESNIQGKKVLFNEYVCYLLGKELQINMPLSGICEINKDTRCKSNNIYMEKILRENRNSICFFSKAVEKSTRLNEGVILELRDNSIFEKILLFDHIIYNTDRNEGNILINTCNDKELYVIDHSHVFKNQTIWDRYCFKQGIKDKDYKDRKILDNNEYFYRMFFNNKNITRENLVKCSEFFLKIINEDTLNKIFEQIPDRWRVEDEDLVALKEYILYRTNHIEEMVDMILGNK